MAGDRAAPGSESAAVLGPPPRTADASAHDRSASEVVASLGSDEHLGLTTVEARDRLRRFGPNELPRRPAPGPFARLLGQLRHPLVYVLLASGAAVGALGEVVDAAVIFGVVAVNAVIGFVQETKAVVALDSLETMVGGRSRVVRDGTVTSVPVEELVPGDVVLLDAGDRVPADLRLLRVAALHADESSLTGESLPVAKLVDALPAVTSVVDRHNLAFAGTAITVGTGAGVVVATGAHTQLGLLHRLVDTTVPLMTPLTRKLADFSKVLTQIIAGLAALTFVVGVARGMPPADMLTAAVALAVGAIPEGLPAAVTITLAVGVGRMARRRAIVRRLPAVETLGGTTVICSDKTGTFTENRMAVQRVLTAEDRFELDDPSTTPDPDTDAALWWCLVTGAACNDAVFADGDARGDDVERPATRRTASGAAGVTTVNLGDPTDAAMQAAARAVGLDAHRLASELPRVHTIPFRSDAQLMATVHEHGDGEVVLVKGAVERIVERCGAHLRADGSTAPIDPEHVLALNAGVAGDGMRVLATAMAVHPHGAPHDDAAVAGPLVFTGLQAMIDPPRAGAAAAVASCAGAGIAVKMITGDHPATAAAIADRLGLGAGSVGDDGLGASDGDGDGRDDRVARRVVTGAELDALDADGLRAVARQASVFARVTPEQKLRLVEALQEQGEVVAMTGDGVNDAPAVRRADIGVAMGIAGTTIAKEAADMVLTDDDFATIEAAVEEGRGVFDNLTKFIVWTLPTNMSLGFVILVAILFGLELPILPLQILWINMTTAVALGLMLAFEPKEPGIMRRPPRDPRRPLLTRSLLGRILLVAVLLVGGAWWLFAIETAGGATVATARTAALNLFVVVEACYAFTCRSLTRPARAVGLLSNRWLLVGVTVQAVAQLALTYLPAMQHLFHTAALDAAVWGRIAVLAAVATAVVALDKKLRAGAPATL